MKNLFFQQSNLATGQLCRAKLMAKHLFILLMGCSCIATAYSQTDKRIAQADAYFAAGEYYTAAHLYGQVLNPSIKEKPRSDFPLNSKKNRIGITGIGISKPDILYKQAESYRLANYWPQAMALYKECFDKDPGKYADALYWHAVCQRSVGYYLPAEESIKLFLQAHAGNSVYRRAAESELQTILYIKNQLQKPDSVLYELRKINTASVAGRGVFAPTASAANQFIIASPTADSTSATVNPNHNRLFYASFENDSLQKIEPVSIDGIDGSMSQGAASISADGNHLYFTQWKQENGKTISSIYSAAKKENGWSKPVLLSLVNKEGKNSKQPFCTADGKYLFFASDRDGGMGEFDIWYAPLLVNGTTGEVVNAGSFINTPGSEAAPFYHLKSNTLVFSSNGMQGMGGYDLFAAKGFGRQWQSAENLGAPVNSSRDDLYFFTQQNSLLLTDAIVTSDRGSECCLETYAINKLPKKKMSTGIILDCENSQPLAGANVLMTDATGKTWQTKTGEDGRYVFELTHEMPDRKLLISKEEYLEKNTALIVDGVNATAWHTDTLLNSSICIEKKLVIKMENVVTVYFDFDRSLITPRGVMQLDSLYTILMEDTVATLQISGYTDGLGTVEYNQILSDKRAKACAGYLIEKGIAANRITFESFGACCPLEMELINGRDNPDGRSVNRRALINVNRGTE